MGRKKTHQPRMHENTHSRGQSVLGNYKDVSTEANSALGDANTNAMEADIQTKLFEGRAPVLDRQWFSALAFLKERAADDERRTTWHLVGKTQSRGVFRALSAVQEGHVSDLIKLDSVMGRHLRTCYSYGMIITVPSMPDMATMHDRSKTVFVSVGSYPSAHEAPGMFLSGVLGTFLYTLLVGVLPDIHLAVFDLHCRMKTRIYRLYASDPESAEPFQLDIEDFHKVLPASVQRSMGMYLDYTVARVLETRAQAQGGAMTNKFSVWGNFGKRIIKPLLVITMQTFASSCELINHPQGL